MSEDLLSEEQILAERTPHIVSFWPYYLYFLWYVIGSSLLLWKLDWFMDLVRSSVIGAFFGQTGVIVTFMVVWWLLMIIPALIFSLLRIKWGWVVGFALIATVATYLFHHFNVTESFLLYATIGLGVLGLVLSDIYRRSHRYFLTSFRIITRLGFLGSTTRQTPYAQIDDLVTKKGFLGQIFNYASILPLTPPGIGTGSDEARVSVGVGGGVSGDAKAGKVGAGAGVGVEGGRSVTVPRSRTYFILYGIPHPDEVEELILERMREKEPAFQVERQTKILGKKLDQLIKEREEEKFENKK
ncbi:MAG: PH domain-containing protein [Candidatus Korarchaeota archaeon]|nr:PH domain-containing protein [Candidatus Korarchaeota archaeon]NIU83415.1 PH domain-containing protein [Candidatus Thorarchaeota archaeon]NIW13687.1 PH domain-containing protein [Candidatus Thorarchaeota archaeon]NIW51786.1 PH domain-containing protein [Candidatus Korarchaeota archaeon]